MPGVPVTEMFRSFKSPAGWGGNYLEPDLTAYGLLKDEDAALFVEYDGYYRHATKEGTEKDLLKNKALLDFAPVGSFVVRIRHKGKSQLKEHALWVGVKTWGRGDQTSLARVLTEVLEDSVPRLRHALHPCVCKRLEAHVLDKKPIIISRSAQDFRETAVAASKGNTAEEIYNFLGAEGFENADIERLPEQALVGGVSIERSLQPLLLWLLDLGLAKSQVAKALKIKPNLLAYSVELNLKPKRQWFLDLGLTKSQVAKAVAAHPGILGYSLEQNLKPTVQWFVDLGLTKSQVAKTVVACPQILGLSIDQNLKPTVQWFLDFGLTKSQLVKAVASHPPILWLSIEQNLNPTTQWLLDLGLTKSQVAKALKIKPNLLALSVELNLKPTRQWFLDLGLTKSQVAKAVAAHPGILGYSLEQNLKPTVQWFVDLGLTKSQVAKTVVALPQILGCSVEKNLKPTVQWLADLGLSKNEVTKMAANFPQILSLSVEKNLASKVKLLHTFLPARDVLGLIARWPCILGYRRQRLEDRLNILAEQDSLAKLISAMPLTDEAFHKRFVIRERKKHYGCSLSYRKAVKIFEKENYQFATSREARAIPPTASHFLLGVVFLLRGSTCTLSCRF